MRVSLFAYCSLRKGFAAPFKRNIHGYASTTASLLPQRRHTAPPCQYCPGYPASTHKPYPPPASLSLTPSTALRLSDAPSRHPSFPTTFSSPTAMPVRLSDFLLARSYLFIINILFTFIITFATLAKNFQRVLPAHSAHRTAGSTYSIEHGQFTNFKL